MQNTSATWKSLWAAGARLEARALINGAACTLMSNPVITRALTQDGLTIGNAVSATCQLSVRAEGTIPRAAEVVVEMRLTDGTTTSEWLPAGTFYIARRQRDPVTGVTTLECYDALLKANAEMPGLLPWTTGDGEVMTTGDGEWLYFTAAYPQPMADLAEDIALLLGVQLDSRTQIATGSLYQSPAPGEGATVRDVLGFIAAANGGNWIITPANRLRLVPVVSAAGAATAATNAVDVAAVLVGIEAGVTGTVTGIRYQAEDTAVVLGDETGLVVEADVGAALASALYDRLVGMTYQPYSLSAAVYDPAAELGDYVRAGANGEVASVLYGETATLSAVFNGAIQAPQGGELSDEYPYIGGASSKALVAAKAYAREVTAELDNSLDQEAVFNRLTNNGAAQGMYLVDGQLYVSASYIQTGTMVANLIKGGTLTLGGANNADGVMQVLDANGNVVGTWDNSGIMLKINNSSSQYVSLGALGFKIFLDSGSNVQTSFTEYHNSSYYPNNTPLGDLIIQYTDENGEHWDTLISPCGVSLSHQQITGGVYTNHSTFRIGADGMHYQDNDSGTYLEVSPSFNRLVFGGNLFVNGAVSCGNGANGTFTTANGKTVTVTDGIITSIA